MKKNITLNRVMLLAALAGSSVFHSCKEDVFNAEKVKATYQDKFPIKDIDPGMDWKMTRQVKVNVSVNEDALTDYTIRVYNADPLLTNSTAKVLAEGVASNTQAFNTTIDCPIITNNLFVCRTDNHNRNVVKISSIINNQADVTFGSPVATRSTRAGNDIENDIKVEEYTPVVSLEKVEAMLAQANEIQPNTIFSAGAIYKISAGTEFAASLSGNIGGATATLIICGKWKPNENEIKIPNGINVYVMDKGEIIVPKNITFGTQGYLGVFLGGEVSGKEATGTLKLPVQSGEDKYFYNAGTIKNINISTADNISTTIYNSGEMNVKTISCLRLINRGRVECDEIKSANRADLSVENGCYLNAKITNGQMICGVGSRTEIGEFNQGREGFGAKTQLGSNALLQIQKASLTEGSFEAPSSKFTLVRIEKIVDISEFRTKGKIYYEFKEVNSFDDDRQAFLDALQNSEGTYSKWGESPMIIPGGDCTENGYIPDGGSDVPSASIPYTYVFEDNYPLVGDYDFNDVVLDVETSYYREASNNIKWVQLNVTLAALGAAKMLGAGLRIVGIPKSAIDKITTGKDYQRFHNTLTAGTLFKFNPGSCMEDDDKDIVIPLFSNAHQVFDGVEQGKMVNTTPSGTTAKPYTYQIIIEMKEPFRPTPIISKDNLDFFICYQYKSMQKRMEVHLYEFWDQKATDAGTIQQANLDLAGNNTWAICVPEFRYPKERINISNQNDKNDSAYPEFLDWARDRSKNQNWYENPVKENTYR